LRSRILEKKTFGKYVCTPLKYILTSLDVGFEAFMAVMFQIYAAPIFKVKMEAA
jgi:hypothetical protein